MNKFLFTMLLSTTFFASAQNTGTINGTIIDAEEGSSTPLLFAKVTVKETGVNTLTDENGAFKFDNIKNGTYTLVCSFTGYDTKEIKTQVISGRSNAVNTSLSASTLSLDDLTLVFATSSSKNDTATKEN